MSAGTGSTKTNKSGAKLNTGDKVLLVPAVLLLLFVLLIFAWYGATYIPVRQSSEILPREVEISAGGVQCTLDIPAGSLTLTHPTQASLGSSYKTKAEIRLERPLRFINCTGLPNWSISLEAQTTLVAADVRPYAAILQPAFDREAFSFEWTFTPEEPVPTYQSHFWLRAIVSRQEEQIERWNLLVRDFPMANTALFGQPTVLWLICAAASVLTAVLLLILTVQRKIKNKK